MLKDFLSWVERGNERIAVSDFENQRYFTRPLTNAEKAYIIAHDMLAEDISQWPAERKRAESRKFFDYVENVL